MKITIEGFKVERLVSKAVEENVRFRQLVYVSDTKVQCYIDNYDLKKLEKLAKSIYRITVISNVGIEYNLKQLLKKPFKIGITILTVILVISQSFFVKTIEITGYKGIPETEIRNCLRESGIREGSYIPSINWGEAEDNIYHVFPEVTWLRLVYDGRKVFLEISEGDVIDDKTSESVYASQKSQRTYCNIIASRSGYIQAINTYRGLGLVSEGDYVEKGQVLILGCVPIKEKYHKEDSDTEYFVKSKGEIWAKVPYRVIFKQELYDEKNRVKGKGAIREKTEQQIRVWSKENLPENAEILNKDLNFSYKENIIEVSMTIEVLQQIGEEQEILIG